MIETKEFEVKRRFERSEIFAMVGFLADGRYLFGDAVSISEGGLLIRSPETILHGTKIEGSFYIRSDHFVTFEAEVSYARVEEFNEKIAILIGVKFTKLTNADRQGIQKYVAQRKP